MRYTQFTFLTGGSAEQNDILSAILGQIGFESFEETEQNLKAYIQTNLFDQEEFDTALESLSFRVVYSVEEIADQNWNSVWESNFQPVTIASRCHIRAPFHDAPAEGMDFDLVIEPKMSFGTAHHETTALMIQFLLDEAPQGQRFLDMGCGTGVLAILAAKMGASDVTAIDNDEWAYNNTIENAERNHQTNIEVLLGDATLLGNLKPFDSIYANINRNILLNDMKAYSQVLKTGGTICFSGFYETDMDAITQEANQNGLTFVKSESKNQWTAMCFNKQ
jgi:ribosomal protein L11 methyltransferase